MKQPTRCLILLAVVLVTSPLWGEALNESASALFDALQSTSPIIQAGAAARLKNASVIEAASGGQALLIHQLRLLQSSEPLLRQAASQSIGVYRVPVAVETVVQLWNDPDIIVRQNLSAALKGWAPQEPSAALALLKGMDDPDKIVRQNSLQAFHSITPKAVLDSSNASQIVDELFALAPNRTEEERTITLDVLSEMAQTDAQIRDRLVQTLYSLLGVPDWGTRLDSAKRLLLFSKERPEIQDRVVEVLRSMPTNAGDRQSALNILGHIPTRSAYWLACRYRLATTANPRRFLSGCVWNLVFMIPLIYFILGSKGVTWRTASMASILATATLLLIWTATESLLSEPQFISQTNSALAGPLSMWETLFILVGAFVITPLAFILMYTIPFILSLGVAALFIRARHRINPRRLGSLVISGTFIYISIGIVVFLFFLLVLFPLLLAISH